MLTTSFWAESVSEILLMLSTGPLLHSYISLVINLFPILLFFRNMTKWWREEWSDLPATFSIHDFVKSTNMVEETIQRNIRKGKSS